MKANRQQVNAQTTSSRWKSTHSLFAHWEVIDGIDDEGHWQLEPEVEFKCRDLDVSTIIISSHLLNTTHGKNEETKTCMNEDHFDGKCSSQGIVAKDLNRCAQGSGSTTESSSGKCRLAPLVTKHANGLHNSNIEKAIASNIQCGNHVLPTTNRQLADNLVNDPMQATESNLVMSECRDPCSRQPLIACETSTINQPSAFNLEGKLPTCSKIGSNCLETLREEKINLKEKLFQIEGTVRKRGLDSRISTAQESTECNTKSQTCEDGPHIARPLDSQVNSKSVQELANFAGLSARHFTKSPVQDPLDVVREGVNIYPGNSKNNRTDDILQSLCKARLQGRRQNYQLARISLLEDKSTSLETPECISLMDQQRFGHTNSVAAAMLLPAFRPYPSKQTLRRNKGTTKLQNQAKCLQENDSFKMYHCAALTSDIHLVQNIADMTLPAGHITVAQLLQTVSERMDQNRDTTPKNSHSKENHTTKGMKNKRFQ